MSIVSVKLSRNTTIFLLRILIITALSSIIFSSSACRKNQNPLEQPEEPVKMTLEKMDATCTKTVLKLHLENAKFPVEASLSKNNLQYAAFKMFSGDTLIYVDSLLPKQQYNFKLTTINQGKNSDTAYAITETPDTTLHNFSTETKMFGEGTNSVLKDVAIINDTDIWAVGAIYMLDSTGHNYNLYNAIHWNGNEWKLYRLKFLDYCDQPGFDIYPADAIIAFSNSSIIVSSQGQITKFNNTTQTEIICTDAAVLKFYGRNATDIYGVGWGGRIIHYDGQKWQRQESGTTLDLLDVWGTPDGKTVWACGYDRGSYSTTVLLRYNGTIWEKMFEGSPLVVLNNDNAGLFGGVWTNSNYWTYLMNVDFIKFQKNTLEIKPESTGSTLSDVGFGMRGTNCNNIFIGGQHGLVGHYNGYSYREIPELRGSGQFLYGLSVKGHTVCVVGEQRVNTFFYKAVIHIIKY